MTTESSLEGRPSHQGPPALENYPYFYAKLFKCLSLYWQGPEKGIAWGLLIGSILLTLAIVACQAFLTFWYKEFYNALQNYDVREFWRLMLWFGLLAFFLIVCAISKNYLFRFLALKWRRFMTEHYVNLWLSEGRYYFLQFLGQKTDNPDQRLAEDLNKFTTTTLSLFFLFFESIVTFLTFIGILWSLSGPLVLSFWGFKLSIPGYLVFAALLYTILGTWVAHKIVSPLLPLDFQNEAKEGNFRYGLVRIREYSESIAFYRGESKEHFRLKKFFQELYVNTCQIIKQTLYVNLWSQFYGQIAIIMPYLLVASRFFTEKLSLGFLMQLGQAFNQVDSSLSVIVQNYPNIISWKASTLRILTFEERLKQLSLQLRTSSVHCLYENRETLLVERLLLTTPEGSLICDIPQKEFLRKQSVLIQGPSGIGKSTFLRGLAGLWPFGEGEIRKPEGKSFFFLPQKPYLPLGDLGELITYPQPKSLFSHTELSTVLKQVGLEKLIPALAHYENWSGILSGGEQQRIAFARLLLQKPDWIFLDEATSALDEIAEKNLYVFLRQACPDATIISIGHRPSLTAFHDAVWDFPVRVETFSSVA